MIRALAARGSGFDHRSGPYLGVLFFLSIEISLKNSIEFLSFRDRVIHPIFAFEILRCIPIISPEKKKKNDDDVLSNYRLLRKTIIDG